MKSRGLKCIAVFVMAVSTCGCSTLREMKEDASWPLIGEDPCRNREAGKLYLEKSEIEPLNVKPDEAFKHTVKCTYCGPSTVQVELIRKVLYDGKVIKEKLELQNLKSGINRFTAEIKVADEATPGIYLLETAIRIDNKTLGKRERFNVTEK